MANFRANEAFGASGLADLLRQYQKGYAPVLPATLLTFDNEIQWSAEQMHFSASAAHRCLVHNWRTMPIGAHTVNSERMGSALILMGNLIVGKAVNEHRAWSQANRDTWREIVVDIWQSISQYDSRRMYTETMYRNVVASLLDKFYFRAAHPSPFFEEGPLLRDLRFLALFAVTQSGERMNWLGPIDKPRAAHIKVPLVYPCTASRPARLRAEQWMAEVYVRD
jgi:hypothetical protein